MKGEKESSEVVSKTPTPNQLTEEYFQVTQLSLNQTKITEHVSPTQCTKSTTSTVTRRGE